MCGKAGGVSQAADGRWPMADGGQLTADDMLRQAADGGRRAVCRGRCVAGGVSPAARCAQHSGALFSYGWLFFCKPACQPTRHVDICRNMSPYTKIVGFLHSIS